MSVSDLFLTATVLIIAARYSDATLLLNKAIAQIDADGVDGDLRPELVALRDRLVEVAA